MEKLILIVFMKAPEHFPWTKRYSVFILSPKFFISFSFLSLFRPSQIKIILIIYIETLVNIPYLSCHRKHKKYCFQDGNEPIAPGFLCPFVLIYVILMLSPNLFATGPCNPLPFVNP
jgi:hypothetical protein